LKTLEHLRARGRERAMLTTEALDAVEAAAPDLDTWHAHQQALQACLAKLPPAQRQLTTLAYAEDLTPAQIAERSGKAANVVHVLMSRLRRVLRECVLARLGFAP
jgi:RNA polymerase sigma factor (sigma-70 family)